MALPSPSFPFSGGWVVSECQSVISQPPCRNELRHEPNGRNRPCARASIGEPIATPRCLVPAGMDLTWRSGPGRVWPLSPHPAAPPLLTSVPPPFGRTVLGPLLNSSTTTHQLSTATGRQACVTGHPHTKWKLRQSWKPDRPVARRSSGRNRAITHSPQSLDGALDPITSHPAISRLVSHRPRGADRVSTHEPR